MEVFFGLLLLASLAVNTILIWYIKRVVAKSSVVYDATSDMLGSLRDFTEHLDSIDELRAFYGDPDFKSIIEHSKAITEDVSAYRDGFIFETKGGTLDHTHDTEENAPEEE
tara:strand:- start:993 stop:1325 length:333 start_codon:yes stop_codon:yes gene_type:complete